MATSTSTTLAAVIRTEVIGAAALGFDSRPGVSDYVTVADITSQPSNTHQFPVLDNVSAAAIAEGTDYTTLHTLNMDFGGTVASATVSEHIVRSNITDMAIGATEQDVAGIPSPDVQSSASVQASMVGTMFARALTLLRDQDCTALFHDFNSSTGTNTGALTQALLLSAVQALDENNIGDERRVMVLHPTQFAPIRAVFDDASTFGAAGASLIGSGSVAMLYGLEVFRTTSVGTDTISSSTVYGAAVMTPDAIGLVTKDGMPQIRLQRDESARWTEVIGVAKWGQVEYRGGATTSGRGGAGVWLYSNTTNQ